MAFSSETARGVTFLAASTGGLTGFVIHKLKHALMAGELKPGERLITRDLAHVWRTSLTPVREALLKLVVLGALETTPAQTFQVPVLTAKRYREIADIRHALEGLMAERASQAMTPAMLQALETINDRYRAARHTGDVKSALGLSVEFRFTLYASADMPTLLSLIENLWLQIGPSLNFLFPRPTQVDVGRHNYDEVIAALRRGDHAAVRHAIESAIKAGTQILQAHFEQAERVDIMP